MFGGKSDWLLVVCMTRANRKILHLVVFVVVWVVVRVGLR
jgi:hypothetical protein